MSDLLKTISDKLTRRINERVASTRSGRPDFYLSDWDVVDDHSAKVLIGFNAQFGRPKGSQVDQWVTSTFEGQLRLALESVRLHEKSTGSEIDAVSGIVVQQPELAPISHARHMIPVHTASNGTQRFADESNRIWEAMADENGNKFLVRVARDDIAAILENRQRKIRKGTAHHRPRFAHLHQAGMLSYDVGDRITFIRDGYRQFGEVEFVGADTLRVRANGEVLQVHKGNVVDITDKSPRVAQESTQEFINIYTKMYGDPDFARKLVTLKGTGLK